MLTIARSSAPPSKPAATITLRTSDCAYTIRDLENGETIEVTAESGPLLFQ